jgi:hypothetical protein
MSVSHKKNNYSGWSKIRDPNWQHIGVVARRVVVLAAFKCFTGAAVDQVDQADRGVAATRAAAGSDDGE